jgi:hypothetical protein
MTGRQSLKRWLFGAIGAGVVALLAAFVPSPFGLMGLFDAPANVALRQPPALSMRDMPPLSAFAEISARPLFNAGRKPDPASGRLGGGEPPAGGDQGELSQYRVVGIVADRTTQRAIVERSGAPSLKLAPGDSLAGWRIDRIDAAGIVASKDKQSVRIGIPKARPRTATP